MTAATRRNLGGGALASALSQVGFLAATALTSVLVARGLGASATGTYALSIALLDTAVIVASAGLAGGLTYISAREGWSTAAAVRSSQAAALALGVVGALLGLAAYALLRTTVFEGLTWSMALWTLGSLPFAVAWRFSAAVALAEDRYELYAGAQLLQAALALLLTVVLIWPLDVLGAIVAYAISQALCAIAMAAWMLRQATHPPRSDEPGKLRRALSFGAKSWSANVLQLVNYRLDIFILNAFASSADVGVYSIAISLSALGWILPQAMESVLMPRTASLDAAAHEGADQARESDEAVARATRHSVLLLVPTAIVVALVLAVGIPIVYGEAFQESVALGFILLPGVLALGVGKVISAVTSGRGRPIYALYTVLMVMPITVVLYLVLIPALGVWGAALASTFSYALSAVVGIAFFERLTRIGLRRALVPTRADLRDYAFGWQLLVARVRRAR